MSVLMAPIGRSADEWKQWRARESRSDLRKRGLCEAIKRLSSFGRLIFTPQMRAELLNRRFRAS